MSFAITIYRVGLRLGISLAEDLKHWKLFYRPPIQDWFKGKVALVGDAAHPMLPRKTCPISSERFWRPDSDIDQGQGGGQAIEDAGALSVVFSELMSKDCIHDRLRIYQEVRKNRAASIQVLSNAGQDEPEKVEAEARQYMNRPPPSKSSLLRLLFTDLLLRTFYSTTENQAEFHDYNFGYDVLNHTQNILTSWSSKL